MTLGRLFTLVSIATAIAAGLGYFMFWWALMPTVLAGSFTLSNGPHYDRIIQANQTGRLGVFPATLALAMLPILAVTSISFWITGALAH